MRHDQVQGACGRVCQTICGTNIQQSYLVCYPGMTACSQGPESTPLCLQVTLAAAGFGNLLYCLTKMHNVAEPPLAALITHNVPDIESLDSTLLLAHFEQRSNMTMPKHPQQRKTTYAQAISMLKLLCSKQHVRHHSIACYNHA